jgi:predicted hydrocarbon binding protein
VNGAVDMMRPLRERLAHDLACGEIRDGTIRYLTLRADALSGMFARLSLGARAEALEALAVSVAENGGKSVAAYLAACPGDADALLQIMTEAAADLGWGCWHFGRDAAGILTLTVFNSPFAAAAPDSALAACAPIRGILAALARHLLPPEYRPVETCCAAQSGKETCQFVFQH